MSSSSYSLLVSLAAGNSNQAQTGGRRWALRRIPNAFTVFERVAVGASWDKGTWALKLAPYLSEEAQAAYMALNDE